MPEIALPDYVITAIQALDRAGFESCVVGGAVRSSLLGLPVHDYDLTTSAVPEEMESVFARYHVIPTGIIHGTLTVVIDRHPLEITTYRTDGTYQDHRHPDEVRFTKSLQEDCARRDFTINAMCYHPDRGIIDFFGGQKDLQDHVLRTVGDPERRFNEDALRILRALRFAAQLHFTIEPATAAALLDQAPSLSRIAKERIQAELLMILKADGCAEILREYRPVMNLIMPQLKAASDAQWNHACRIIANTEPEEAVRMAVLLLHACPSGSRQQALRDLKLTVMFQRTVMELIGHVEDPLADRIDLRRLLHVLQPPFRLYLQFRAAIDPEIDPEKVQSLYEAIQKDHDCIQLRDLGIGGRDLEALGLQGAAISQALNEALEAVMSDRVPNEKEALLRLIDKPSR